MNLTKEEYKQITEKPTYIQIPEYEDRQKIYVDFKLVALIEIKEYVKIYNAERDLLKPTFIPLKSADYLKCEKQEISSRNDLIFIKPTKLTVIVEFNELNILSLENKENEL